MSALETYVFNLVDFPLPSSEYADALTDEDANRLYEIWRDEIFRQAENYHGN